MSLDMLDVMGGGAALPVRATSFGLRDLIGDVTRAYERRAGERGLRISVAADEPCQGDPQLVRRVLENFVENALKYTPSGGEVWVELAAGTAEGQVVRVRDTGPGIPSGARDRVFEAGFRLGRDANVHRASRGLGLAFCKVAAEAQGGRVWVEAGATRGSAFCIELPSTPAAGTPALGRAA